MRLCDFCESGEQTRTHHTGWADDFGSLRAVAGSHLLEAQLGFARQTGKLWELHDLTELISQSGEDGVERAQDHGKWLGALPKGFERDDEGYLHVLLDPDQDDGEVGYLEVRRALERIEADESYRAVARDLPNLTRQTLMNIDKDPERRRWYLETEAADERVDAALESVR